MFVCPECGSESYRRPRNSFRKLFDRALYECSQCGKRTHVRRSYLAAFHRFAQCPKCGTRDLSRLKSRDQVDAMSRNPLRLVLKLLGAPLYHCTFCRLQFRDLRARRSLQ